MKPKTRNGYTATLILLVSATMISANIEEAGKCSHVIKDLHTSTDPSTMFYDAFRMS